jgi:H+-translocating NAD(P) transhydrogenase
MLSNAQKGYQLLLSDNDKDKEPSKKLNYGSSDHTAEPVKETCLWSEPIPYSRLTIGVPAETLPGEKRVALSPDSAAMLIKEGFRVVVEKGAGAAAQFPDDLYEKVGAKTVTVDAVWRSDIVVKITPPTLKELAKLESRTILSFIQPAMNKEIMSQLQSQGATAFAMDCIPRMLSRGQAFDALSSQVTSSSMNSVIITYS